MIDCNKSIGDRLKELRNSKKQKQGQLATALNTFYRKQTGSSVKPFPNQTGISNLENGKTPISPLQLKIYAEYFNVSADSILGIKIDEKDGFYPNQEDVTYTGVIQSLNYLFSAFDEEKIIGTMEIKTSELGYDGIEEHTEIIPVLRFDNLFDSDDFVENPIMYYLNQILKTIPLKAELKSVDSEAYTQLLKKWANCSGFTINNKKIDTYCDDCPF